MEQFTKIWLPIGAFIISTISLYISFSNFRYARKYEAAKKKTELLSKLIGTMTALSIVKEKLNQIKQLCHLSSELMKEGLDPEFDELCGQVEKLYKEIQEASAITDPAHIEGAIAIVDGVNHKCNRLAKKIDAIFQKVKECSAKKAIL